MTTRRQFVLVSIPAGAALLGAMGSARAQAARLSPTDPTAVALGYHEDSSKVDPKKYPTWAKGHECSGCQLYMGKPTDTYGPCNAFGGKLVHSKGWCTAWVKKA